MNFKVGDRVKDTHPEAFYPKSLGTVIQVGQGLAPRVYVRWHLGRAYHYTNYRITDPFLVVAEEPNDILKDLL